MGRALQRPESYRPLYRAVYNSDIEDATSNAYNFNLSPIISGCLRTYRLWNLRFHILIAHYIGLSTYTSVQIVRISKPYRPLYRAVYILYYSDRFFGTADALIAHYIGLSTVNLVIKTIFDLSSYRPLYRAVYRELKIIQD